MPRREGGTRLHGRYPELHELHLPPQTASTVPVSVLFCTPAYGGQVTLGYFNSCLELRESLIQAGVKHNWLTTQNESLITRGRDCLAAQFLKTDYERLMFLDADIEFKPEDVAKLWNLDMDIAVAAYPMKRPDAPVSAWRGGKLVRLEELGSDPVEVDFAGTGFMMIHRRVFERLQVLHPEWRYEDGIGEVWAFFQDPVEDGIKLSEDYFFCKQAREAGFPVALDPTIRLKHWGSFAYGS